MLRQFAQERDIIHLHILLERIPHIPARVSPPVLCPLRVTNCKTIFLSRLTEPFVIHMLYPCTIPVQYKYQWSPRLQTFRSIEFITPLQSVKNTGKNFPFLLLYLQFHHHRPVVRCHRLRNHLSLQNLIIGGPFFQEGNIIKGSVGKRGWKCHLCRVIEQIELFLQPFYEWAAGKIIHISCQEEGLCALSCNLLYNFQRGHPVLFCKGKVGAGKQIILKLRHQKGSLLLPAGKAVPFET